ncbi:MAG: DUF4835 family protein [Rubricoccaceae bacterium]
MRLIASAALALLLAASPVRAQELFCEVTVNRSAIQGTEYAFLDELRGDLMRYLNDRAWTEDVFGPREQIDCTIQIIVRSAQTLTQFTGEIVVQASRPIYGTGQRSNTLVISDNAWNFTYTRGQNLVYDPSRYDSFLSVIDFYAYLILGYDYDTFDEMGGQAHFERARRIAELGRAAPGAVGWVNESSLEQRSRLDLVSQLLDPAYAALRRAHFTYHYHVLDHFLVDHERAWETLMEMLASLNEQFLQQSQRRYSTDLFFTARYRELVDVLREAPQRNMAYAYLSQMDPVHLSAYDALVAGR